HGNGHDVDVTAPEVAADVEPLQQRGELGLVRFGDADEEQNATALARAALRKEEESLVATGLLQILMQDGFSVDDTTAHRADPDNLGHRRTGAFCSHARVTERRQVCLELAAQPGTRR